MKKREQENGSYDSSALQKVKGKAIPVTIRGDPQGCETSRLLHFLGNRLTDGDEVVRLLVLISVRG
jgi:hypothetical protein